jgi:hypothetical protein
MEKMMCAIDCAGLRRSNGRALNKLWDRDTLKGAATMKLIIEFAPGSRRLQPARFVFFNGLLERGSDNEPTILRATIFVV